MPGRRPRSLTTGEKLNDEGIKIIAKKYNKSNAQILIRWCLQHGCISIPKSVFREQIEENINIFDFGLSLEDMKILDRLNENLRFSPDPNKIA